MRNLLALIGLVIVGFAGIGYYRGWYTFNKTTTDGKMTINVDVDNNKVKSDFDLSRKEVGNVISP